MGVVGAEVELAEETGLYTTPTASLAHAAEVATALSSSNGNNRHEATTTADAQPGGGAPPRGLGIVARGPLAGGRRGK